MPRHEPAQPNKWQWGRVHVKDIVLPGGAFISMYRCDKRRPGQYEYILYRPGCNPATIDVEQVKKLQGVKGKKKAK